MTFFYNFYNFIIVYKKNIYIYIYIFFFFLCIFIIRARGASKLGSGMGNDSLNYSDVKFLFSMSMCLHVIHDPTSF